MNNVETRDFDIDPSLAPQKRGLRSDFAKTVRFVPKHLAPHRLNELRFPQFDPQDLPQPHEQELIPAQIHDRDRVTQIRDGVVIREDQNLGQLIEVDLTKFQLSEIISVTRFLGAGMEEGLIGLGKLYDRRFAPIRAAIDRFTARIHDEKLAKKVNTALKGVVRLGQMSPLFIVPACTSGVWGGRAPTATPGRTIDAFHPYGGDGPLPHSALTVANQVGTNFDCNVVDGSPDQPKVFHKAGNQIVLNDQLIHQLDLASTQIKALHDQGYTKMFCSVQDVTKLFFQNPTDGSFLLMDEGKPVAAVINEKGTIVPKAEVTRAVIPTAVAEVTPFVDLSDQVQNLISQRFSGLDIRDVKVAVQDIDIAYTQYSFYSAIWYDKGQPHNVLFLVQIGHDGSLKNINMLTVDSAKSFKDAAKDEEVTVLQGFSSINGQTREAILAGPLVMISRKGQLEKMTILEFMEWKTLYTVSAGAVEVAKRVPGLAMLPIPTDTPEPVATATKVTPPMPTRLPPTATIEGQQPPPPASTVKPPEVLPAGCPAAVAYPAEAAGKEPPRFSGSPVTPGEPYNPLFRDSATKSSRPGSTAFNYVGEVISANSGQLTIKVNGTDFPFDMNGTRIYRTGSYYRPNGDGSWGMYRLVNNEWVRADGEAGCVGDLNAKSPNGRGVRVVVTVDQSNMGKALVVSYLE